MKIEKVYVISATRRDNKNIHIISEESRWRVDPTLDGGEWRYLDSKRVLKDNYSCPSDWVALIPPLRGCKATAITINGKVIVL